MQPFVLTITLQKSAGSQTNLPLVMEQTMLILLNI